MVSAVRGMDAQGAGRASLVFFSKKSITAGDGFFHLAVMVLYAVVYVVGSWVTTSSLGKSYAPKYSSDNTLLARSPDT